jgi:signal transduction histidine kinase/ActR/RegA family two-component response regulator
VGDQDRSREALNAELEHLRTTVAELRAREYERVQTVRNLRKELRLVTQNAKNTGSILRSTVALTNEAASELRQAKRKAEAAALAKTRFLANMSHELRTPMTAILGYTETLLEDGDLSQAPKSRIDHLNTLQRNGHHLMRILNDILDLSKIEAGGIDVERVSMSPFEILADIESLMRNTALEKGIGLDFAYEGDIPARIESDPTRLRQILMNLVGNAVKFTEQGGVRVVTTRVSPDEDNEQLRFTVSDTGCGLAPEALARIFDAFAQADLSTTRRFGGTGLGLTISRQLAELLDGDIKVESIEGQGSTFTLTITTGPLQGVHMVTDAQDPGTMPSLIQEREEAAIDFAERILELGREIQILLVEDGEDNRRLIAHILNRVGFTVVATENGAEGVRAALEARDAGQPFDLILMDMQMPVLDGYEATQRLREERMQTPVIALTAHAMTGDRERCLEAGCDAFATKPIDRRELIELILDYFPKPESSS